MEAATKKKLFFGALGAGMLLLINRASELSATVNGLQFSFAPGGAPRLVGLGGIEWPIRVRVANPGLVTLPLQGLSMTLSRVAANGYPTLLAATDPAGVPTPNIAARATTDLLIPVRTSVVDLATEIFSIIQAKGLGRYLLAPSIFSNGVSIKLPPVSLTY